MKVALVSIDPKVVGCGGPTRSLATYQLSVHARSDDVLRESCEISVFDWVLPNFGGKAGPCAETRRLASDLAERAYDLVGFSTKIWNFYHVRNVARLLKRIRPRTIVLAGGYQVMGTRFPPLMLDPNEPFDFLITGEGEEPFRRLLLCLVRGEPFAACPALWLRGTDGGPVRTGEQRVAFDLSRARSTFGEHPNEDFTGRLIVLEASRGCPYGCGFCEWAITPLQVVPLERVFWEIDYVMAHGGNKIFFADGTFNLDRTRRFHPILQFLIDRQQHYTAVAGPAFRQGGRIGLELRPELITDRCAELMEDLARCAEETCYEFGLQTTGAEAGRLSGRQYNERTWATAMGRLGPISRRRAAVDIISDLPGNSLEAIADSHRVAIRAGAGVGNWRLFVLPGTRFEERADDFQLEFDPMPPHHVRRWMYRSEAFIQELIGFGYLCDLLTQVFHDLWMGLEQVPPDDLHFAPIALRFHAWLDRNGTAAELYEKLVALGSIRDAESSSTYAAQRQWILDHVREHFRHYARTADFYGTEPVGAEARELMSGYLASHPWFAEP